LTKLVEIIGEAAKQVSPETRARFPACPGPLQPEVAVFAVVVASKVEFVEARPFNVLGARNCHPVATALSHHDVVSQERTDDEFVHWLSSEPSAIPRRSVWRQGLDHASLACPRRYRTTRKNSTKTAPAALGGLRASRRSNERTRPGSRWRGGQSQRAGERSRGLGGVLLTGLRDDTPWPCGRWPLEDR
jgi:hypothetical protein